MSGRERVDVEALAVEVESVLALIASAIERGTVTTMLDVLRSSCTGKWTKQVRALGTELDEAEALLRKAEQLAEVAMDWNLSEVEIDGEMVDTLELRDEFRTLLKRAGLLPEEETR